jgi:hypothetical protein
MQYDGVYSRHELKWEDPRPEHGVPYRTCSFCGSMHPEDLLQLASDQKIRIRPAKQMYGFPHKFFILGIKNPMAGKRIRIGTKFLNETKFPIYSTSPKTNWAKIYTSHVLTSPAPIKRSVARLLSLWTGLDITRRF